MTRYVLDASAILAFLNEERGGEKVEAALPSALISTVNMAEVIAKLLERGVPDAEVSAVMNYLDCEVVDFTLVVAVTSQKFVWRSSGGLLLEVQAQPSLQR